MAIGVEVGGGNAQAHLVVRQAKRTCRVLEPTLAFLDQQEIVQALGPDSGGREIEVELAVSIGVETGHGGSKSGPRPAKNRVVTLEVFDPRPALARGERDFERAGGLEARWSGGFRSGGLGLREHANDG